MVPIAGGAQEVADGVQSITPTFHQFAGGNPEIYVATPTDFQQVDAARLLVPMKVVMPSKNPGEANDVTRNISVTASIRNRTL